MQTNKRKKLNKYIFENSNFFNNYQGNVGYKNLIEDFYLQPYVDPTSKLPRKVFAPHYYHYNKKKLTENEYIDYAKKYVSNSIEIITYRSSKMIKELKRYITFYRLRSRHQGFFFCACIEIVNSCSLSLNHSFSSKSVLCQIPTQH